MTRPVVPPPITDAVAPLGPNARAMVEDARRCYGCDHRAVDHRRGIGACNKTLSCECRYFREVPEPKQPSPRPTVLNLIADIAAGIRVLRTYGVEITEAQVMERANNIAAGLEGNYRITGMGDL